MISGAVNNYNRPLNIIKKRRVLKLKSSVSSINSTRGGVSGSRDYNAETLPNGGERDAPPGYTENFVVHPDLTRKSLLILDYSRRGLFFEFLVFLLLKVRFCTAI